MSTTAIRLKFVMLFALLALSTQVMYGQQRMNLGYLVVADNSKIQSLEYPHNSDGKIAYAATVIGLGAVIASDDRGIDKTMLGTSTPGVRHSADVLNHFGDLTYVAPALGLVYLSGGHTNEDFAWKAGVAVLKAGAVGLALKELVGRERPNGPDNRADVFRPGSGSDTYSSFPSGHTLVAFSVATVWADEKPTERYEAYGLATLVGLARIYSNAHWPSDVFFGAILGYTQGREAYKGQTNLLSLKF